MATRVCNCACHILLNTFLGLTIARNDKERTIEGDLFRAFVSAGAISKANADDPKKSSLVRCARTDKGVHAAGNLISLKLIVEDEDIVQKINNHLPPQIRVWGMERTSSSFNAYHFCESRIYEYLIPTHCFLPPHPKTFLGKMLSDLANEAGDRDGYEKRQEDVAYFWQHAEVSYVKPVLEQIDPPLREQALKAIFEGGVTEAIIQERNAIRQSDISRSLIDQNGEDAVMAGEGHGETRAGNTDNQIQDGVNESTTDSMINQSPAHLPQTPLESAIRAIRLAINTAKLAYRISDARLARVRSVTSRFLGTHNYHNYTIHKSADDRSAQRIIKSIVVAEPIVISNTEWLSIKIHGQSFMMHQIRKMVSMCALVVRCGTHEGRIQDTFLSDRLSIPKAPGLGLLLERPIFDGYNNGPRVKNEVMREEISFKKYEREIEDFKEREIYARIFREDESEGQFFTLMAGIDSFRHSAFLYLSSLGLDGPKMKLDCEDEGTVDGVDRDLDGEGDEEEPGEG